MYKLSCKLGNIDEIIIGSKHENNEFLRTNPLESLSSEQWEQATEVLMFTVCIDIILSNLILSAYYRMWRK